MCARSGADGSVAIRSRTEKSASGACGANACQAVSACAACVHGHSIAYVDTVETGCVASVKLGDDAEVAAAPAAARPEQVGVSCVASQARSRPSAVTMRRRRRLSAVVPSRRDE